VNKGLTGFDGQTEPTTASRCAGHRESWQPRTCGTHENGGLTARPAPSGHCRGWGASSGMFTGPGAEPESAALVEAPERPRGPCDSGDTLVDVVGDAGRTRVRVPADPLGEPRGQGPHSCPLRLVAPDSIPLSLTLAIGGQPGSQRLGGMPTKDTGP